MTAFTVTPVGKGIMRCKHTGLFPPEDVQTLAKFLEDYNGKLLIDPLRSMSLLRKSHENTIR
jgi:hypothetical protein